MKSGGTENLSSCVTRDTRLKKIGRSTFLREAEKSSAAFHEQPQNKGKTQAQPYLSLYIRSCVFHEDRRVLIKKEITGEGKTNVNKKKNNKQRGHGCVTRRTVKKGSEKEGRLCYNNIKVYRYYDNVTVAVATDHRPSHPNNINGWAERHT